MADIKLFVCCHQQSAVPKHPLLVPIQVGAALSDRRFPGFIPDDTRWSISEKNRSYCELTAQYWAWKNTAADFYGFFHYRRYLYPDVSARYPYCLERAADLRTLTRLGYENFSEEIQKYDMIVPKGENMYLPVREHYARAEFHHEKDLRLVETIVREKYPAYIPAMERYLNGSICYFGNIHIMRRPVFQDYCAWLFDILAEFDRRVDMTGYSAQELRVDGYLGERLLGVYYTHRKEELRALELPRVHFLPDRMFLFRRAIHLLLPPGSRRRSWLKKQIKRGRHGYKAETTSVDRT